MTSKAARSRGMPRRSDPVAEPRSRTPLLIGAAVVAFIAVAAIVAFALSGTTTGGLSEPARVSTAVSGNPLPALTDPASDPAIGQPIPSLTGIDLAGEPITIGPSDGPMAIVLLAHWCEFCQAEVPVLVDYLASTGMPEGVELVTISTSIQAARPNYPPSTWLEREGWTAPTMVDDATSGALRALGMSSFPGFVFVDADGRVVQRTTGQLPSAAFDQIVRSLAP
jgi:cytochrome c biogenesis protein CcmG, thiol:disulfide interchange protein DsbE